MSAREADARARNELKESRANNGLLRLRHNPEPKGGIILSKLAGHLGNRPRGIHHHGGLLLGCKYSEVA